MDWLYTAYQALPYFEGIIILALLITTPSTMKTAEDIEHSYDDGIGW